MRTSHRIVVSAATVAFLLLAGPAVTRAYAVSIRDLVALTKEGVSDPVLIALIETDGSRFTLKADDIRDLRAQGLSDAVIVAMLRTRPAPPRDNELSVQGGVVAPVETPREYEPPAPAPPPPPAVVVTQTNVQKVEVQRSRPEPVAVYVPVYVPIATRPVETKKEEPVYWGWGGQRRPDAWKEPVIK